MESKPEITVIVPHRMSEDASVTLRSLSRQTFQGFKTIVVPDQGKGANWARNQGFRQVDTEYVLFSDNDITWKSRALETLLRVLKRIPVSYSYGRYIIGDVIWSHQEWSAQLLKERNYISTMSLWRTKDFPGFDEAIQRFQDWDVYLTALEQGKRGVYCGDLVFTTEVKEGITHGNPLDAEKATDIIKEKHGLQT